MVTDLWPTQPAGILSERRKRDTRENVVQAGVVAISAAQNGVFGFGTVGMINRPRYIRDTSIPKLQYHEGHPSHIDFL